jgi:hypothetical protein
MPEIESDLRRLRAQSILVSPKRVLATTNRLFMASTIIADHRFPLITSPEMPSSNPPNFGINAPTGPCFLGPGCKHPNQELREAHCCPGCSGVIHHHVWNVRRGLLSSRSRQEKSDIKRCLLLPFLPRKERCSIFFSNCPSKCRPESHAQWLSPHQVGDALLQKDSP